MAVILVDVAETIVKEIYFWCARTQGFAQKAGRIMRRIWLLCWLILTVLPSWAAKRLSVAQLEQLLTADFAAHKQDSEIARKLAGVALSERISQTTFARLDEQFHSSPLASQALRVLADQSQFLDLPVDESVSNPAPENEAQTRMLHAAQDYVSQTLRRLPNFLATRTINLYDDTPQAIRQGEWPTRAGLHLVGKSSAEISVSREREDQPPAQGSAIWQSKIGLLSGGEFGTTLGMILTDMATGEVRWSHWERTSPEMLAVFRYSVPASARTLNSSARFSVRHPLKASRDLQTIEGSRVSAFGRTSVPATSKLFGQDPDTMAQSGSILRTAPFIASRWKPT